jgi:hypothetical protein
VYWAGIYLPTTTSISSVQIYGLTNATGAFSYAAIGLYNSAGTLIGLNNTNVASTVLSFTTTVWNSITLTAQSAGSLTNLAPGTYAVAILLTQTSGTAPAILRTNQSGSSSGFLLNGGVPGGNSAQVRASTTSGLSSLPTTAPAVGTYANSVAFWGLS